MVASVVSELMILEVSRVLLEDEFLVCFGKGSKERSLCVGLCVSCLKIHLYEARSLLLKHVRCLRCL